MALVSPGSLVTQISGSVGGQTFARNPSGMYVRNRTMPVNPQSAAQSTVRQIFNALATAWRDALTSAERTAWDTYAQETVMKNRIGQDIHLSGQNHFIRSNSIALLMGEDYVADGPAEFGVPAQEELWTPTLSEAAQTASIAYTFDTDVDGQMYAFFGGHPFSASRTFYGGPWRYLGGAVGDNGVPPASPAVLAYPWTIQAGQAVVIYCRRFDADGRLTEPFRQTGIVGA